MIKYFTHHLSHLMPLFGILFVGFVGFFLFAYDRTFQSIVMLATALGYITWGVVHHYIHKDLHFSVIVEYISVAILGLVLVYSLLFRA